MKAWQFVWLRVEITTIVAYAMLVLLRIIFIITTIVPYAGKRVNLAYYDSNQACLIYTIYTSYYGVYLFFCVTKSVCFMEFLWNFCTYRMAGNNDGIKFDEIASKLHFKNMTDLNLTK